MLYLLLLVLEIVVIFFLSRKLQYRLSRFVYKLTKSRRWTVYVMSVLFLPGTFFHEASHFLAALFLLVPVGEMEMIPEIDGSEIKMGSVSIGKVDPIRKFIIGIAPFFLGVFFILFVINFTLTSSLVNELWELVIVGYVVFEVGNTMFLSKKDLKVVWEFVAMVIVVACAFYLLGISFPTFDQSMLLNGGVLVLVRKANVYLLLPIVIDALALIFINSLSGK
jgi:hypothetical protein